MIVSHEMYYMYLYLYMQYPSNEENNTVYQYIEDILYLLCGIFSVKTCTLNFLLSLDHFMLTKEGFFFLFLKSESEVMNHFLRYTFFEIYSIVITDTHFMYQTLTLCIFYATFVCNYVKQIHDRDRKLIASSQKKKQYLVIFLASLQIKNIPINISCIFTNNETISHNV